MTERLQPILSLLDEGISLYRRNFVSFVLIAASWFVPVAIAAGLVIVAGSWIDEGLAVLLAVGAFFLLFPLLIYLIGGLSRAAVAAAAGQPVRFREVMAISPVRAASMGCFTIVYYIILQTVSSIVSIACICPAFFVGGMAIGLIESTASGAGAAGAIGLTILIIFFIMAYGFALIVGGATYSSLIYALQPWVQEARPFGVTLQHSFELIGYRFWQNLVVWGLAAVLVAAVGVSAAMTIGLILPLPLVFALGDDSKVAQAISASAWLIGFVVVLPPLPIWMALLYQRNRTAREGADLHAQVQEWWGKHFDLPGTESQEPSTENQELRTENL